MNKELKNWFKWGKNHGKKFLRIVFSKHSGNMLGFYDSDIEYGKFLIDLDLSKPLKRQIENILVD